MTNKVIRLDTQVHELHCYLYPSLKTIAFAVLLAAIFGAVPALAQIDQRPLKLPVLHRGDPCPVTRGSHETVPPESYIFCSRCLWFGKGPVYFAWSYRNDHEPDAMFSLPGVPQEGSAYSAKTPWVSKPDYSGPILIRGRRLDGKGTLRFEYAGPKMETKFILRAPSGT